MMMMMNSDSFSSTCENSIITFTSCVCVNLGCQMSPLPQWKSRGCHWNKTKATTETQVKLQLRFSPSTRTRLVNEATTTWGMFSRTTDGCVFMTQIVAADVTATMLSVASSNNSGCGQIQTTLHAVTGECPKLCFLVVTKNSTLFTGWEMPSVLWRCWLGCRKGIWPVKNWVVRY